MIGYIKGKLLSFSGNELVIENGGIGYEACCSSSATQRIVKDGGGELYTYMAVRDDGIFLYGFISPEEKNMFLKLISVSGVGPKVGIAVLSGMSLQSLALAIASSDVKTLSSIKGLGKKTAERIILELREKITADVSAGDSAAVIEPIAAADEDSVIALMGLGFNRNESIAAVKAAYGAGAATIQDVLSYALKSMRK